MILKNGVRGKDYEQLLCTDLPLRAVRWMKMQIRQLRLHDCFLHAIKDLTKTEHSKQCAGPSLAEQLRIIFSCELSHSVPDVRKKHCLIVEPLNE